MATTVVSWNIAKRREPWRQLVDMDADVALLQEAGMPPAEVVDRVDTGPEEHWNSHVWSSRWWEGRFENLYDRWPMVVKLSDRVEVEWFKQVSPIAGMAGDEIAVSGIGTVAAARVIPREGPPFIVVSMYARWMKPHPSVPTSWGVGYQDGSAHRIISDLSAFIGSTDPSTHRILAAGDLNMIYGATEDNRLALPAVTARSPTEWPRWAWSSWGPGTRTAGAPARHRRVCHPTRGTCPPTTPRVRQRRRLRTNSTTCSHRGASTTALRFGP